MRALCLVLALALVPAAGAATARERPTPGPISTVAIAGTEVAYANEYRRGCHEVRLWDPPYFSNRRLASHCFAATSTGSGVAGAIADEGRALWLTYTGGNIREWSLWTKSERTKARKIAFATADADGPAPIVLGRPGEGSSRTRAAARSSRCPERVTCADVDVPRTASSRSPRTRGGWAAVLANGTVLAMRPGPVVTSARFRAGTVSEAILTSLRGLIVKTSAGLEIRKGARCSTVPLPRRRPLPRAVGRQVAYGVGAELRLRRPRRHRRQALRRLAPRFHAQLGRRGLAYGSGRTIGFRAAVTAS